MAFFDEMGKKLSMAGQSAAQKTKDMADIARINGEISEEERRINNTYYQIGKMYASMHEKDYEEAFAGMIGAIKESKAKIDACRQQIQDIKGIVHCERCGAEVANNAAFCSSCGAPMPKPVVTNPNAYKCTNCGATVDKTMRFCTYCGTPIVHEEPAAKPFMNEAPVEPEPIRNAFCTNCGAALDSDTVFCTECGTRV